jgi:DNA polymerase kappa
MSDVDQERLTAVLQSEANRGGHYADNARKREAGLDFRAKQRRLHVDKLPSATRMALAREMELFCSREERLRSFSRIFVCIDMDAFYCACEEKVNPSLRGRAFAVGSLAMISSASYAARKYGVRSAMPGFVAKKLCPDLIFVSHSFALYEAAAVQARSVFARYDPSFQAASLDEAILDISQLCADRGCFPSASPINTSQLFPNASPPDASQLCPGASPAADTVQSSPPLYEATAGAAVPAMLAHATSSPTPSELAGIFAIVEQLRAQVRDATGGLTCSAGVAPNPMLAKICSDMNKPDGLSVCPFDREGVLRLMESLPVRRLPGVGRVMERELSELGIATCKDVLLHAGDLLAAFSARSSHWLVRSALGLSDASGGDGADDDVGRKSISSERTFSSTHDDGDLVEHCTSLVADVSARLRELGLTARTVTVKLKLETFELLQRSCALERRTDKDAVIKDAAVSLLRAACEVHRSCDLSEPIALRLLGVRLSSLERLCPAAPTMIDHFVRRENALEEGASVLRGEAADELESADDEVAVTVTASRAIRPLTDSANPPRRPSHSDVVEIVDDDSSEAETSVLLETTCASFSCKPSCAPPPLPSPPREEGLRSVMATQSAPLALCPVCQRLLPSTQQAQLDHIDSCLLIKKRRRSHNTRK